MTDDGVPRRLRAGPACRRGGGKSRAPGGCGRARHAAARRGPGDAQGPLRRLILLALLLGGGTYGAYAGHQWWTTGRFFVTTDDAYVQADISTLAAKVSGYLEAVPVVNGQAVKAGDVIARIEDGDYRLALKAAEDKLATQGSVIARIARQAEAARAQVLQGRPRSTPPRPTRSGPPPTTSASSSSRNPNSPPSRAWSSPGPTATGRTPP